MPDVKLKTRIQNKYKTLNEWNTLAAGDFIPLKGEVCYAVDGNMVFQKIGDGVTDFTELEWLLSPSVQSDHAENDEQSFAYIKNRLAYDTLVSVSEDKQLIKDMTKILTLTYPKEILHQALPDLAALLPTHINTYLIEQLNMDGGDGVSDFNIFKSSLDSFVVNANNFFTTDKLSLSEYESSESGSFILMAAGNPVFINIWITLSDTRVPLYPMDYNLDKDYCVFFALSKSSNSFFGAFIGDAEVYTTDTCSLELKHILKNSVVPIDDRFLINSKSNWDEMDSSKVSYIYNKYGNIATSQLENDILNSYKSTLLQGSFEIGNKYADGYHVKNCSFSYVNWQSQYIGLPLKDFKVRITYNMGKNTSTYENCAFFYGQDYFSQGNSNPLIFIGNPSFLSKAYYAYSQALENLIIADQEDNGLPFLFGFDLSLDQPLVKCFLEGELISDNIDYHVEISTSTVALATKMVPDYLIMKEKEPWIYDKTKESLMTPTAYAASGVSSVATGTGTIASGQQSTAFGNATQATGRQAFAIGYNTLASGQASFAQGRYTEATKVGSTALGYITQSTGAGAIAHGTSTWANGQYSIAGGDGTKANALGSVALGYGSMVDGKHSVALGNGINEDTYDTIEDVVRDSAKTISVLAEDYPYETCQYWTYCLDLTPSSGELAVAHIISVEDEGEYITLQLDREIDISHTSFDVAQATWIDGENSFSFGQGNYVADHSITLGQGLISTAMDQFVIGKFNEDTTDIFIIGQGSDNDNRKNIFTVDSEGNVEATNFIANYVDENGEKSIVSLSEIANKQNSKITPEQTTFFDTIPSQNLLDVSTQKDGMLHTNGTIYTVNDNVSYQKYKYFEQYIPVQEGDILALQCITYNGFLSSFDSNCVFARVTAYNENKQVLANFGAISTDSNPQYFYHVPATVAFVRITLDWTTERSELMVTKNATQVLSYQPYQGSYLIDQNYLPKINDTTKINLPITEEGTLDYGVTGQILQTNGDGTTSWVEDDAMVDNITPEQTTFFEFEAANNLLDVSTVQTGMIHTNGRIYTIEDSAAYGAYRYFEQYIPVNKNDVLTLQWDYEGNRYSLISMNTGFSRVTAYDENKNVLPNLSDLTTSSNKLLTYVVPETVAYVRITLSSNFDGWSNVALVKNVTGIIPYEEYGASGKSYIKPEYIKEKTEKKKEILAFLPDEIVCAVGRTIEIYNNQVCPLADKYHIRWYSTVGKALERKYSITGDADFIGDYKLTFEIYDDDEMVIFAKDTTIKIVEDNIPENFAICPIGDSLTNGKPWLTEVPTLSNNKVSYVGTRGNGKHEGRSGFTSIGYTTAHDYTFEAANPETVHPFWDGTKFSWSYYKTNTGVSADAIQIFLGTNDLFGNTSGETLAENLKTMVDDIRLTETDMPIFLVLTILVGSQNGLGNQRASDGFTAMYKGKNKYLLDCKFIKAMQLLQETFKDYDNLYFIPLTQCHDNQYNFGEVETPVNPRAAQTEIMPKEAIHPQQQGYEQMADVMYSVYCRAFTE